jgi:hypothetical protein
MSRLLSALALALLAGTAAADTQPLEVARQEVLQIQEAAFRHGLACLSAPVPPAEEFVAAAVFKGETLANVLITPGYLSTIVHVDVAPGAKPITVFLGGTGLIWDFDGDVDRVRRVVVIPDSVAVRGIAADRVDFSLAGCRFYPKRRSGSPDDHSGSSFGLSTTFGRAPDHDVHQYSVDRLNLPDGTFSSRRPSGPPTLRIRSGSDPESDLRLYYPAGFRELDVRTLTSPTTFTVPATHPGEAGLVQLLRTGAIRRARPDEVRAWLDGASRPFRSKLSPDFRFSTGFDFVISREVELPVQGGQSFLVPVGVPEPMGIGASGACVGYMDGFRLNNEVCVGERNGLGEWHTLESAQDDGQCRLLPVSSTAWMQAVSMYRPEGSRTSFLDKTEPMPVDVRVERPGDVVLVLNTSPPAIWRVAVGAESRIAGVLLTGGPGSRVDGLAADTPVVAVDRESNRGRPKPDAACAPFFAYIGHAFMGGPGAAALDRQVHALTGRSLDALRAAYAFKSVEIR